ncbi:hypothetical protein [Paenibacillus cremeus]|uniref:Uncharacterized protein n=1 Tax=Paenibacillus cremeus TaxID=2163881 RepID=A0A559KCS6_9BACL|nr:hypothetical protein [Paenibacillus cremeus]TVY09913.1 hypothetical protein FPZ49_11115 [Paenibacillus cremeus]
MGSEFDFQEIINGNKQKENFSIYQRGFMWVVEDLFGRVAFGKSRSEAIDNMIDFINKEQQFARS